MGLNSIQVFNNFKRTSIPRLSIRKHAYYIRRNLPKCYWEILKKKEIRYALNTKDYLEAKRKVHRESLKIDIFLDFVKHLQMELKNKKVILTDMELKQVLTYRMRVIDDYFDDHWNGIISGKNGYADLTLFDSKALEAYNAQTSEQNVPHEDPVSSDDIRFIHHQIQNLMYHYLDWIKQRPDTTLSVQALVDKIKEENYSFFQLTENEESSTLPSQMLEFYRQLVSIEEYTRARCANAVGEETSYRKSPFICNLEDAVKHQKQTEMTAIPTLKTHWKDVFKEMIQPKKCGHAISDNRLEQVEKYLDTIFDLIDKEYIEQITYEDCRMVNNLIYRVPKNWRKYYPNRKLHSVLLPESKINSNKALAAKTVTLHLWAFVAFLRYCRKQRLINDDFASIIVTPTINKMANHRDLFTPEELQLIFDPANYFLRLDVKDDAEFWVPLIALYSGARLNEICQIRLEDIKTEDGIPYIQITDEGELQFLKTPQSKRRIPIHPKLKELGFLGLVARQRIHRQTGFLFNSLKFQAKNHFGAHISRSFRYYLRHTLEIKDNKKVFHSFRHTVKPRLRNAGVSAEFVDILCGWEGNGSTGTKNYAHRDIVPIRKLHQLICKLKYPELEQHMFLLRQTRDHLTRNVLARGKKKVVN